MCAYACPEGRQPPCEVASIFPPCSCTPSPSLQHADDWKVLLGAFLGLCVCGPVAALLPSRGFTQSGVMGAGLIALGTIITVLAFAPVAVRRMLMPGWDKQDIPPVLVFLVTGALGVVVGGLIGGAIARADGSHPTHTH